MHKGCKGTCKDMQRNMTCKDGARRLTHYLKILGSQDGLLDLKMVYT